MKNFKISAITVLFLLTITSATVFGQGKVHIVDIPEKSKVFVPEAVTIEPGDTVRWTNNDHDKNAHSFASIPGPEAENKEIPIVILKQGKSYEHTFNKPGEYRYFCYVHRGMVGKIIVKPANE
jgi:plastocyanin